MIFSSSLKNEKTPTLPTVRDHSSPRVSIQQTLTATEVEILFLLEVDIPFTLHPTLFLPLIAFV